MRAIARITAWPTAARRLGGDGDAARCQEAGEEATKGEPPKKLPFVNVHRYLSALKVRVPHILRYDEPAGIMVLEDLSDVTFEEALRATGKQESLYKEAVELLAYLRAGAEKHPDPACLAFTRSFDEDLYDWELHHFSRVGFRSMERQEAHR